MREFSTGHNNKASWFAGREPFLHFAKDEHGTTTIEFVMWVPLFLTFMLLVADVGMAFMRQANVLDISRDAARIVARHGLDAPAAIRLAADRARFGEYTPEVTVDIDPKAQFVTVTIFVQIQDLAPFGILQSLHADRVAIQAVHAIEPI
jgi:Flp pilus assembly protein TadG